jgi:hypothetical protein
VKIDGVMFQLVGPKSKFGFNILTKFPVQSHSSSGPLHLASHSSIVRYPPEPEGTWTHPFKVQIYSTDPVGLILQLTLHSSNVAYVPIEPDGEGTHPLGPQFHPQSTSPGIGENVGHGLSGVWFANDVKKYPFSPRKLYQGGVNGVSL